MGSVTTVESPPQSAAQDTTKLPTPMASSEVVFEKYEVGPELATEWLSYNVRNRNKKRRKVAGYARDMRSGVWYRTGDTIRFDWDGVLIDGQNRLFAVVESGETVILDVVRGLDPASQNVMDTGASRTHGDQLGLRNFSNAPLVSAITRKMYYWEPDVDAEGNATDTHRSIMLRSGDFTPTHSELDDVLDRWYDEIREATHFADNNYRGAGIVPSILGLAHIVFHQLDTEDAKVFLDKVARGIGMLEGDPALALRERIRRDELDGVRPTTAESWALLCLAWNATRNGEKRTKLQLPKGGLTPRNFPEPK